MATRVTATARWTVTTLLATWLGQATVGHAQTPIRIIGAGECRSCAIDIVRVASLRPPNDQSAFVMPTVAAVDRRGHFYVADPFGHRAVYRYDEAGKAVATIGRPGSGPGEFERIVDLEIDSGDSLHVFGTRHSVFTPGGALIRDRSLPGGLQAREAMMLGPQIVMAGSLGTPAQFGRWLHVTDGAATTLRSFGGDDDEPAYATSWTSMRRLARADSVSFWAARVNTYRIELWSTRGVLRRILNRDVAWFPAWRQWDSRVAQAPPPPRLWSVWQDSSGLLWVALRVSDAQWKASPVRGGEEPMPSAGRLQGIDDTIIEIIDPSKGTVVISRRFPGALHQFIGGGLITEITEHDDGEVVLNVWRLQLNTNPKRGGEPDVYSKRNVTSC